MKKASYLSDLVEEIVKLKMEAADSFIGEVVEPLGDIGNPEKLIGKPLESWTPQDIALLQGIYGPEDATWKKWMFKRRYFELKTLEREV